MLCYYYLTIGLYCNPHVDSVISLYLRATKIVISSATHHTRYRPGTGYDSGLIRYGARLQPGAGSDSALSLDINVFLDHVSDSILIFGNVCQGLVLLSAPISAHFGCHIVKDIGRGL